MAVVTLTGGYSERAQRAIMLAQAEARRLARRHAGTEHLLLGILAEGRGVAAVALRHLGLDIEHLRSQTERILGLGDSPSGGEIEFTPRARRVIFERSRAAAQELGHRYVGTEHLLLGLLAEEESAATRLLSAIGATHDAVRAEILRLLGDPGPGPSATNPHRSGGAPSAPAPPA